MANKTMKALPNWKPGSHDVICARGKLALDHVGNQRFREIVNLYLTEYSQSACKFHKSRIVSQIVEDVRSASPTGGFVKLIDDVWYEVSDRYAREKVGQTFRDLLHTQYRSSTKAKARARSSQQAPYGQGGIVMMNAQTPGPQTMGHMYQRMSSQSGVSIVSNTSSNIGESSNPFPEQTFSQQLPQEQQRNPPIVICLKNKDSRSNIAPLVTRDECCYNFMKQLNQFLVNEEQQLQQQQQQAGQQALASCFIQHEHRNDFEPMARLHPSDLEPKPLRDATPFRYYEV